MRGTTGKDTRHPGKFIGVERCLIAAADHGPRQHDLLLPVTSPLLSRDDDALGAPPSDRLSAPWMPKGDGQAEFLQVELVLIDAARDVERQHQDQVDLARQAYRLRRQEGEGNASQQEHGACLSLRQVYALNRAVTSAGQGRSSPT